MQQSYQMQKVRCTITACDPAQRLIHARFKDGGSTSIAVFEVPQAFRWPQVGEVWTVTKQNNYWILGSRVNDDSAEALPITALSTDPDLRLDGSTIYDLNGNQVVAVTMSGIQNNYVPIYSVTASGWLIGSITASGMSAGGVLSGVYPNPGMAAGAAATNVGALGGVLGGTLPNPSYASIPWTTYAPLWIGSSTNPAIGNGTLIGKYQLIGKTCNFRIGIYMGSTTTYGSGVWELTLPFTPINDGTIQAFTVWAYVPLVGIASGAAWANPGSNIVYPSTGTEQITSGTPYAWAAGGYLAIQGTYESA